MEKAVEAQEGGLHLLEPRREFERALEPGIHDRTESAVVVVVAGQGDITRGIRVGISRTAVVRPAETDPRSEREPAEVGLRIGQLVKSVEAEGRIIVQPCGIGKDAGVKNRVLQLRDVIGCLAAGKVALQVAASGRAVVKNGQSEKRSLLGRPTQLRQPGSHLLPIVHLPAGQKVDLEVFGQPVERGVVVRLGIDRKLGREEVLQKIVVADAVDVRGGINVLIDDQTVLERDNPAIAARRVGAREGGVVAPRIVVVGVVSAELAIARVVRPVSSVQVDAESRPAFGPVIEFGQGIDFFGQGKAVAQEKESAPGGIVAGLDVQTRLAERRVKIGEPEDRGLADIHGRIGQNHAVVGINPGASRPQLVVRLGVVARGQTKSLCLELPEGRRPQTHRGKLVNLVTPLEIQRLDLPLLQIVNRTLPVENLALMVNAHVARKEHLAGLRIVLGIVTVNIRPPEMDLHIVLRHRHAALEAGATIRPDLHRHIAEAAELGKRRPAARQKEQHQQEGFAHTGTSLKKQPGEASQMWPPPG